MEPIDAFDVYNKHLFNIFKEKEIYTIDEYAVNGASGACSFLSTTTRKKQSIKPFNDFKYFDELYFLTKDTRFAIANLFFLRPHINNAIAEDRTYIKNAYDARYMMYASIAHQNLYNYFDRLGDILNSFFHTGLPDTSIYFGRVLNNLPAQYKSSANYIWLEELYTNHVKPLHKNRDDIVHHWLLETEIYYTIMENRANMEIIKEAQQEKESQPEQLLKIYNKGLKAFEMTVNLISELPDKPKPFVNV